MNRIKDWLRVLLGLTFAACILPLAVLYWVMLIPFYLLLPVWAILGVIFDRYDILDCVLKIVTFPLNLTGDILDSI